MEKNDIKNPIIQNLKKRVRDLENGDEDLDQHFNKILKSNLLSTFIGGLSIISHTEDK